MLDFEALLLCSRNYLIGWKLLINNSEQLSYKSKIENQNVCLEIFVSNASINLQLETFIYLNWRKKSSCKAKNVFA